MAQRMGLFITTLAIDGDDRVEVVVFTPRMSVVDFLRDRFSVPRTVAEGDVFQHVIDAEGVSLYVEEHALSLEVELT